MQNKTYRLLKDLPFVKAGEVFKESSSQRMGEDERTLVGSIRLTTIIWIEDIENFDEWFEEVRIFGEYYYVIDVGHVGYLEDGNYRPNDTLGRMEIGNIFETREKAEKYLAYLKAKEVVKQDTKGFKPDWSDRDEIKYWGYWDFYQNKPDYDYDYRAKRVEIFFRTREDLKESFKKHPEEWKTYLTYEQ